MRQLLYASNCRRDMDDAVLQDILAASRRNNARCGVTGVLLYLAGGFMQVLEGEGGDVQQTYERICADPRHWNTVVLVDHQSPRAFSQWSMGFERAEAMHDGMFAISKDAIEGKLKAGAPVQLLVMLKTFYRVNAAAAAD